MAEEFLREIYKESKLLFDLKRIAEGIRMDAGGLLHRRLQDLWPDICNSCKRYLEYDYEAGKQLWDSVKQLRVHSQDSVGLGDCLEAEVIPRFQACLDQWGKICVDDGKGICIESSESGFLTLKSTVTGIYWYSKVDPMWEAYSTAKQISGTHYKSYSLWGCGLGYLAYQLWSYSYGTARIDVFEPDERIAEYAMHYGVLDWIPDEKLEIHVTQDILQFLKSIDETVGFHVTEQAFVKIPKQEQEPIYDIAQQENTRRLFERRAPINYYQNISNIPETLLDFDGECIKNEVVVVAGGPSVDDSLEYLRQAHGKGKSIIAVGTVFSKLIKNGIRPDIVVIMDGRERVAKQIEGLYTQDIPLMIASTAWWEIGAKYQGDKYLVFINGATSELAEEYRKAKKETVIWAGSSVTVLALQLSLFFGAARVELVGADFAYPGNATHATDTPDRMELGSMDGLFLTECVNGGVVYSSPSLSRYRRQVEDVIAENKQVTFVNLSKVGARIKGTEENL